MEKIEQKFKRDLEQLLDWLYDASSTEDNERLAGAVWHVADALRIYQATLEMTPTGIFIPDEGESSCDQ